MRPRPLPIASTWLVLVALASTSCMFFVAASGVGAGVVFAAGDIELDIGASPEELIQATETAMKEMDMPVMSSSSTALEGSVVSQMADGKKVEVNVRRSTDEVTKLSIRVGRFGDKSVSAAIYSRIQRSLDAALARKAADDPTEGRRLGAREGL